MQRIFKMSEFEIDDAYRVEERKRVLKLFSRNKHGKSEGFMSATALADWWIGKLDSQNGCCVYCATHIVLIEQLIEEGWLKSRAVRGTGKRGPRLELERIDASGAYRPSNCALVCYYCNNDKSYIYSAEDYKKYLAPAKKMHFNFLATRLKKREF